MLKAPRHEFVPPAWRNLSYLDRPLPIGSGQTVSQPYIVAYMSQALALKPTDRLLEIGTGSGYHAAVLSLLAGQVYTIEIIADLGIQARQKLETLGYKNIELRIGDGYQGWLEKAPFDAIILTAAPAKIPQPLLDQLGLGGRLIAPVGEDFQELVLVERDSSGYRTKFLIPVRFVPMTGRAMQEKP